MWKIYFWIYLTLTIAGLLTTLPKLAMLTFANWEGMAEGLLGLIGTYSYAFKRYVFSQKAWKIILWYFVAVWILGLLYSLGIELGPLNILFQTTSNIDVAVVVFLIILALPGLYAIYKLSGVKLKGKKKKK